MLNCGTKGIHQLTI